MERKELCAKIKEAETAFFGGECGYCEPYGSGHINDTFLAVFDGKRYILQRMNHMIFPRPDLLMENIIGVSSHIRKKAGADKERASLAVVYTRDNKPFFVDSIGSYWRVYEFCEGTVSRDRVENARDFELCGEGFGAFQGLLSDYPAETLHESIANFHNTEKRYESFIASLERDVCQRATEVEREIRFVKERREFTGLLLREYESGGLPLRVTHNDTKLNNILFDEVTGEPVCVIDLDTVMPGFSVNDFGDSIRFGASTAAEDETDLDKVWLDLGLFESYARGFLKGCGNRLTKRETELLPIGAIMMTFECGMRFLTDYLDGDVYFRTHREKHNLDRARNQFKLVSDMEKKLSEMNAIIDKILGN